MSGDANIVTKKMLQKIANHLLTLKKFKGIDDVEVYYAFSSPIKTAMCDAVYGLKIKTKFSYSSSSGLIKDYEKSIGLLSKKSFNQSVCCTDVVVENS
jgi:hypothetical protein